MMRRPVRLKPDATYICVSALANVLVFAKVLVFAAVASGFSRIGAAQTASPSGDLDPRIVKLVASISEERLGTILKKLESFGTRSTLSSADSPTSGIGAARQWILDEMKSYSPKLQVSFDTHQVAPQGRITRPVSLVLIGRGSLLPE